MLIARQGGLASISLPVSDKLGRRAQARRGALPAQGLTHLFAGRRGLCNARGLRVLGSRADQVCDPATGQPNPAA